MHELSNAWFEYIDILSEGGRAKWVNLRQQRSSEQIEVSEKARRRLAYFEKELRLELLDQIGMGKFHAFGRNITHDIDAPLTKLSPALFNPSFTPDWDASALAVFGQRIIDIKILLPGVEATVVDSPIAAKPIAVEPASEPIVAEVAAVERNKGGRPNDIGKAIRAACNIAQEHDPNFEIMQVKEAHRTVNSILKTLEGIPLQLKTDGANARTFAKIFSELRNYRKTLNTQN